MTACLYPDEPGHRGVATSVDAARCIEIVSGRLRRIAFAAIRSAGGHGLTTNELAERVRIHRDSIQPRTTELKLLGRIRDSGARRSNANGRRAIVWTAVTGEPA